MLGMSADDYQKQFNTVDKFGQRVNFAGQTLDDFYISMLSRDSNYQFSPNTKGVGLGSVRPVTVPTVPSVDIPNPGQVSQKLTVDPLKTALEFAKNTILSPAFYEEQYNTRVLGLDKVERYEPVEFDMQQKLPPREFDIKRQQ